MIDWLTDGYERYGRRIWDEGLSSRAIAALLGMSKNSGAKLKKYVLEHGPPTLERVEVTVDDDVAVVSSPRGQITTLEELLAAAAVDLDEWRVAKWVANKWDAASGDTVRACWQVKAWLERRQFCDVRPIQPIQARTREQPIVSRAPGDVALIIPDTQHGFTWGGGQHHDRLVPLHDRVAVDCVLQLAEALQPNAIILLGDHLDLAEWSTKYPRPAEHRQTTEPAVFELHWMLAQLRAVSSARIVYVEGNHDARIKRAITSSLDAAANLRPANDPTGPEVLSIERLLCLADLDIEYVGPYGEEFWLWDKVRITHGDTVRGGGGKTAVARLAKTTSSEIYGHIHRLESVSRTIHGPSGPEVITCMSPGCLAHIDGRVPGSRRPDYQQGVGICYLDDRDHVHMSVLPIHDGRLVYAGVTIEGQDRGDEIAEDIGYPQAASSV